MAVKEKWAVYCTTEATVVSAWSDLGVAPTACPNDGGHSIDANQTAPQYLRAKSEFYMNDGTDVYKIEINGTKDGFTFTKMT